MNYHKHIHTGEGGILVTNNKYLAEKMRLIRNHAEAVVEAKGERNLVNMLGHNVRLGEIECAIGIEQLKKLNKIIKLKRRLAKQLDKGLSNLDGLITPIVKNDRDHVYYVYGLKIDINKIKVSKHLICYAIIAEGVPLYKSYANIHLLPMYQKKIAYGSKGFPWRSIYCQREINYNKGICPIAEELQDKSFFGFGLCSYELNETHIDLIIKAFHKVWENLDELKG